MGVFTGQQLEDVWNETLQRIIKLSMKIKDEAVYHLMHQAPDSDYIDDLIYAKQELERILADDFGVTRGEI